MAHYFCLNRFSLKRRLVNPDFSPGLYVPTDPQNVQKYTFLQFAVEKGHGVVKTDKKMLSVSEIEEKMWRKCKCAANYRPKSP